MAEMAADAVMLLHGAFVLFAVLGGGLVLRNRRWAWLHGPAFLWAGWIELTGGICPLTPLENWLRAYAGQAGYPGGFVEHTLGALLYPEALTRAVQIGLGIGVLLLNGGLYLLAWQRSQR